MSYFAVEKCSNESGRTLLVWLAPELPEVPWYSLHILMKTIRRINGIIQMHNVTNNVAESSTPVLSVLQWKKQTWELHVPGFGYYQPW